MPHPVDRLENGLRSFGERFRSSFKRLASKGGLNELQEDFDTYDKSDELDLSLSEHSSSFDRSGSRSSLALLFNEDPVAEPGTASPERVFEPAVLDGVQAAAIASKEGRVLTAYNLLRQLVETHSLTSSELLTLCERHGLNVVDLQSAALLVWQCIQEVKNDKGWGRVSNGALQASYKQGKGSATHSYKFESVFNTHLDRLLALTREVDLHPTWTSTTLQALVLHQPSDRELVAYNAQWQPPPFTNLDVLFHSHAVDVLEEDDSIVLTMMSIPTDEVTGVSDNIPAQAAERQRIQLLRGSCVRLKALEPAADGSPRTLGQVVFHIDPQGGNMPPRLIKFVLKIIAPFIHRNVNKTLQNVFSSVSNPLPTRMNQRWEFYEHVRQRVAHHSKRTGASITTQHD